MSSEKSIGVFDSGVGGISVLKALLSVMPNENYIYFGDNKRAPYGDRTSDEIEKFCFEITDFLISQNCKIIVIACNTAVASAFKSLKNKYSIPIVGVVSNGAKAAVRITKNKNIGVLATVFTVKSEVYLDEIKKLDSQIKVYQSPCKLLCPMIESGWESFEDRLKILEEYMSKIPETIDTLILGCTHYPFILDDIKTFCNKTIVDPGFETAIETKRILEDNNLLNKCPGSLRVFTSGDINQFQTIAEKFLKSVCNVEYKSL